VWKYGSHSISDGGDYARKKESKKKERKKKPQDENIMSASATLKTILMMILSFHFIYFIYLFINPHQDGTIKTYLKRVKQQLCGING